MKNQELPDKALSRASKVSIGKTGISRKAPLHTIVATSVAVCLIDLKTSSCALRLVKLSRTGNRQDAMLQADAALEDVLTQLCPAENFSEVDKQQQRIRAKLFGGADLKPTEKDFQDGANSIRFVRSWLKTRRIPVVAENLGGMRRREIVLLPGDGVVYCRSQELDDEFLSQERAQIFAGTTRKIELF
jgi:chemotaxis protein CheD